MVPSTMDSSCHGRGVTGSFDKQVGDHLPLALDLDRPPALEPVAVPQLPVGPLGDLDAAGHPAGLHAAGGVHGVAPQVVAELVGADDPGHHRPAVDTDADLERLAA